jgi:hypothetical protein
MHLKILFSTIVAGLFLASCASQDASKYEGYRVSHTAQDPYIGEVNRVIKNMSRERVEMQEVKVKLLEVSSYHYTLKYHNGFRRFAPASPEFTESCRAGDCKDLSLVLFSKLRSKDVRFVFGFYTQLTESDQHSWLYWNNAGVCYILDPTINKAEPICAQFVQKNTYVPKFSFGHKGKSVHFKELVPDF